MSHFPDQPMQNLSVIHIIKTEPGKGPEGVPVYTLENGSYYIGSVQNSLPNGPGKEFAPNLVFEGTFRNGKWHGPGRVFLTSEEKLEIRGEFINGAFCGI